MMRNLGSKLKPKFQLLTSLMLVMLLSACAYGQFGALDERNALWGPAVPKDFANTVPNNIGTWKFYSFGRISPTSDVYTAQFYDTNDIKRSGDDIWVSTYTYTNKPDAAPNGKPYSAIIRQVYLNCSKHTYSNVVSKYYPTTNPEGKVVYTENLTKKYKPEPMPDYDTISKVSRMVCKKLQ